jgi:hypothetical protein
LGCKVKIQNGLFSYFDSLLEAEITLAKLEQRYDEGIFDIDYSKSIILNHNFQTFQLTDKRKVYLHSLSVKNGIAWNDIYEIFLNNKPNINCTKNGFYYPIQGKITLPYLAIKSSNNANNKYSLFTPLNGKLNFEISEEDLLQKFIIQNSLNFISSTWNYQYNENESKLYILSVSLIKKFFFKYFINFFYLLRVQF